MYSSTAGTGTVYERDDKKMNRAPYRIVTPPRNNAPNIRPRQATSAETIVISKGETLIVQAIISGVLLLAVLLVSMIDIAPLSTVRNGLGNAFAGATTWEELVTDVREFGAHWLNIDAANEGTINIQEPLALPPTGVGLMPSKVDAPQTITTDMDLQNTPPGLWD